MSKGKISHPDHVHGQGCGHTAIKHNDHVDYLSDGKLHHLGDGGCEEHVIEVSDKNPDSCNKAHRCEGSGHQHGPNCGHERVPHGDHYDYLVDGRLHHVHGDHCDDHGEVDTL